MFEAMKRLALHMAEQLVLGELNTSPKAMERLVQRCLDELDHPVKGMVVLELHPDDKARLQKQDSELMRGIRLEAVHDMKPGSVRVFANDTVVEDLVENRLQALVNTLSIDEQAWQKQSAILATPPDVVETPVVGDAPVPVADLITQAATAEKEVVEEDVETEEKVESDDAHS
jgi:hypothetical protein